MNIFLSTVEWAHDLGKTTCFVCYEMNLPQSKQSQKIQTVQYSHMKSEDSVAEVIGLTEKMLEMNGVPVDKLIVLGVEFAAVFATELCHFQLEKERRVDLLIGKQNKHAFFWIRSLE